MPDTNINNKRYDAIDGLRAYSAIGIVLMHVLANGNYNLTSFIFKNIIGSFGNLVFLFMVISSFSMCCGYYDKIINNKISVEKFYSRRYAKVLPFFALLCALDFIISPSLNSVYEIFANLTLCFGLLPNANISVIGVSWFLGVVFVFYMLFPFFCYLISNKVRAWLSFMAALIFNFICSIYFFDNEHILSGFSNRSNIVYCAVFFFAGGLIFIYRKQLERLSEKFRWLILALCIFTVAVYYIFGKYTVTYIVMFSLILIYAIGNSREGVFSNSFVKFLSSISLEIYLCHMVIFRILEKMGILHIFDSDTLSYIIASTVTLCGAIVFSLVVKKIFEYVNILCKKNNSIKGDLNVD